MKLIIGDIFEKVICESFLDHATGRIRVRPISLIDLSNDLMVECCKKERERYPIGTKFMTTSVKVCKKPDGRIYLYAKNHKIVKI
jgi:hypothetical protein